MIRVALAVILTLLFGGNAVADDAGAAELQRAVSFACRCAAITCTRAGADPPRRSEVAAFW